MTEYVDKIAPVHDRTSCNDENLYNAAYGLDDRGGYGRCHRCTLLAAAKSGPIKFEYDRTFNAIGKAVKVLKTGALSISVEKFEAAYKEHKSEAG